MIKQKGLASPGNEGHERLMTISKEYSYPRIRKCDLDYNLNIIKQKELTLSRELRARKIEYDDKRRNDNGKEYKSTRNLHT